MLLDLQIYWAETPTPEPEPEDTGGRIRRRRKPASAPAQEQWTLPKAPLPQQHVEAVVVAEAAIETTAVARLVLRGQADVTMATGAQAVGRLDLYAARVAVEAEVETLGAVGLGFRAAGADLDLVASIEARPTLRLNGTVDEQTHSLRSASEGVVLNWREEEELLALLEII